MPTKRHNIRYNPNSGRLHFADATDRAIELSRIDDLISNCTPVRTHADRIILRIAQARRRKMTGWVIGARSAQ